MTKKSFKINNPAHHYIDTDNVLNTDYTHSTDIAYSEYNTDNKHNTYDKYNTHNTDNTPRKQCKTKRLNLLLLPGTFDSLCKIAVMKRKSVNELINNVLKDYSESEADVISKYNEVFPTSV